MRSLRQGWSWNWKMLLRRWRLSKLRKVSGAVGILLLLSAWCIEQWVSETDDTLALVRQMRGELELHCRHDSIIEAQKRIAERVYAIQADLRFQSLNSNLTESARTVRRDTYHAQHLIDLHDAYLAALNQKHDWVESFPYRKGLVSYVPDQEERHKNYFSAIRGRREDSEPILTNASTMQQLVSNLRALNARIQKAALDAHDRDFFGDLGKANIQRKGRELIGTNTLDTMSDASAAELRSVLQAYLKRAIQRNDEVKHWNEDLVATMKRLIESEEVELYRNATFRKCLFWLFISLFVLGTLVTIVEKWLEPEETNQL